MIKKILNTFSRKSTTTTTVLPLDELSPDLLYSLLTGQRILPTKALEWYRKSSSVATAVDLISETAKHIRPALVKDGEFITKHQLLEFLDQPNGFDTYSEFFNMMSKYYLITGNSYIVAVGNVNNTPIEIYSANPAYVNTIPAEDMRPLSYDIYTGEVTGTFGRETKLRKLTRFVDRSNLKELYHVSRFSSIQDRIMGDSPLNAISLEIDQQLKGRTHNLSVLDKGGRLSLVVVFKDEASPPNEVLKQRRQMIDENLSGAENAGKIASFSGKDIDIHEFGTNNKDMDYYNLDILANEIVYLRYGIPLPMVTNKSSTYNNMETSVLYFYENTVVPHVQEMFDGLSKFLLPRFGLDQSYRITYNPSTIKPIMRQTLNEIEQRKKIGVETINELREIFPERDAIDNGDRLLVPTTSQFLDTVDEEFEGL